MRGEVGESTLNTSRQKITGDILHQLVGHVYREMLCLSREVTLTFYFIFCFVFSNSLKLLHLFLYHRIPVALTLGIDLQKLNLHSKNKMTLWSNKLRKPDSDQTHISLYNCVRHTKTKPIYIQSIGVLNLFGFKYLWVKQFEECLQLSHTSGLHYFSPNTYKLCTKNICVWWIIFSYKASWQ